MRTTRCALTLFVLAASASVGRLGAQEVDAAVRTLFESCDRDRDGRVTRAEFPGSAEQFAAIDADRDGRLTLAEVEKSAVGRRVADSARAEAGAPRPRDDTARLLLRRIEAALRRYDQNRNGSVERREWTGADALFLELDGDGDGRIGPRDRTRARAAVPPAEAEPELPRLHSPLPRVDELLEKLDADGDRQVTEAEAAGEKLAGGFAWADTNRDGRLDRRELTRLVQAVDRELLARQRGDARPEPFRVPFAAWDRNRDGRLEAAEWQQRRDLFPRIDSDRDAAVTPEEVRRYVLSVQGTAFVERFDLDGDGRVTAAEFGGPNGAFRRADRNGDGVVSAADR